MKKIILSSLLLIVLLVSAGCAKFESFEKSWESDTKGLARTVTIYSLTGEELAKYEGDRVRVEEENKDAGKVSILLDGKRLSFHNAIVVIEEQ